MYKFRYPWSQAPRAKDINCRISLEISHRCWLDAESQTSDPQHKKAKRRAFSISTVCSTCQTSKFTPHLALLSALRIKTACYCTSYRFSHTPSPSYAVRRTRRMQKQGVQHEQHGKAAKHPGPPRRCPLRSARPPQLPLPGLGAHWLIRVCDEG